MRSIRSLRRSVRGLIISRFQSKAFTYRFNISAAMYKCSQLTDSLQQSDIRRPHIHFTDMSATKKDVLIGKLMGELSNKFVDVAVDHVCNQVKIQFGYRLF